MRCISPIQLVRPVRAVVPCGKCNYCLQSRRADWSFRLLQELKTADTAHFLTFTYAEPGTEVPYDPGTVFRGPLVSQSGLQQLNKVDVQLFKKRLREKQRALSAKGLRYYTVGEYGTDTGRPHYHSIMFNLSHQLLPELPRIWTHGHVDVGDVNIASIHYVTKYVVNRYDPQGDACPVMKRLKAREPPFSLMSTRPGIGANYINTHLSWHRAGQVGGPGDPALMRNYTQINGFMSRIPRYYKSKLFTDRERAYMAYDSIMLSDQAYNEELERLSRLHHDPGMCYDERERVNHDLVFHSIKSKSGI